MNDMLPSAVEAKKREEEQKKMQDIQKKRVKKDILKSLGDKSQSEFLEKHKVTSKVRYSDLGGIS